MLSLNRNVPYLKQQISALVVNTSPIIVFICIIIIFGYILSFSETAITVLSVTPGYLLPSSFWIWTAFTFCFIEFHFYEVLTDIITVGLCGKLLEPLWGQMEMFTFFAITNLGVAVLTSFLYLFIYMCTKNSEILFDVHIHGLAGYVAGMSVAVKQIMPDHLIAKTRLGKLSNKNIPLAVFLFALTLWLIGLLDGTYPAMFGSGLIISWIYLRFYQYHTNGRGDSSEGFSFASFFPNVAQPIINIALNPLYVCCLRIGFISKPAPARSISSSLSSISISMPGVDPHDIERRRQIALKALSERLKSENTNRQNTLPKSFPNANKHSGSQQGHHSHHHGPHQHHAGHQHHGAHQHHQHTGHQHHDVEGGVTNPNLPPLQQHFSAPVAKPNMNFFIPPAIPLPPPPGLVETRTDETLISIDHNNSNSSNTK